MIVPGPLRPGEKVVDLFAGAGGASLAIEHALGCSPDYAVNHDLLAIETHKLNHPNTHHLRENIWKVDPLAVTEGAPVGLLWASPDCRHFSRAKGGKPVSRRVRSLANVVVKWARDVEPRLIFLENVREFETWGPLVETPKGWLPDPERKGEYFRRWVGALRRLGYAVETRVLNSSEFGTPQDRRRLFLVGRRDGMPITWPAPTHGPGLEPYRTAANDVIDWGLPVPSIFTRKKPLAEATLRRIARGIHKFVLGRRPFIVNLTHGGRVESVDDPLRTVTGAHRGEKALVVPHVLTNTTHHTGTAAEEPVPTVTTGNHQALVTAILSGCGGRAGQTEPRPADQPMRTLTSKADGVLVAASLVQTGYGEREGQAPRCLDPEKPLGTVVAGGNKHAICAAVLKHYGGVVGQDARRPVGTVTAKDHHSVLAASLIRHFGKSTGQRADLPAPTVTAGGDGKTGLVGAHLVKLRGTSTAAPADAPTPTVSAQGQHVALVYAFLTKYFGTAIGAKVDQPLPTVTTKHRHGVVLVTVDGEEFAIADIGMRMFQPHELARAQDFHPDYFLLGTKTDKVRLIGNAVPWRPAAAVLRANMLGVGIEPVQPDLFRVPA